MLDTLDHGDVRELRLARPPVNALTPELLGALCRAVTAAPGEGVRGLLLSGRPGMFSAGLDVPRLLGGDRAAIATLMDELFAAMRALAFSPIPVVAAITGHSPAGGCVLAIFCDHLVMADGDFKIGLNEVEVGLPVPPVLYTALARRVGDRQAAWLAAHGHLVSAAEAQRLGLVDELAPVDRVVEVARQRLGELLALPPRAVAGTREVARAGLHAGFDGLDEQISGFVDAWFSDETQGAMRRLVERLAAKRG